MAVARPPAWEEVERDERFQTLTPDQKLETLNNWARAAEEYGLSVGAFYYPEEQQRYSSFVESKTKEYSPQPVEEVGTLQGIANAAANAWDSSQQALKVVGGVTPDEATEISKLEYNKQARSLAPGYRAYQEAEGWDAVKAFVTNPVEVTTNIVAEGLAGSLPALAAGTATGLAGAAVAAPTVVGAPIGFAAGQVTGTFAGSLATEYGSKILGELQEAGMDIKNPDSIVQFFSNEELVNAARTKGLERGIPVAAFDAVTAGIGGRVSSIVKAATKAPAASVARQVAESAAVQALTKTPTRVAATELGLQAAGGGLGEIAGAVVAGEPIEPKAVFAEVVGEVGPGAIEIAQGRLTTRRKAEVKAAEDRKISETLKVEQTLQENNAPLTAQALRDTTVKSLTEDKDAERLREFTLQGEQLPVAKKAEGEVAQPAPAPAPTVQDQFTPEALQKLTDEQLLAVGSRLGEAVAGLQTTDPARLKLLADRGIDPKVSLPIAQAALDNARNEYSRRRQAAAPAQPAAAAPAPTPAGTAPGTVAFAAAQERAGAQPPQGGVSFAPPEEREVPGLAAVRPPATVTTPEEINRQREATFGLQKKKGKKIPGDPLRNLVEIDMNQSSATPVLKLLADNGVVPQGTASLAQIPDKEKTIAWLRENGFDKMGGQSLPLFLREKQARGETLTPFTPAVGLPIFRAAEAAAAAPTELQTLSDQDLANRQSEAYKAEDFTTWRNIGQEIARRKVVSEDSEENLTPEQQAYKDSFARPIFALKLSDGSIVSEVAWRMHADAIEGTYALPKELQDKIVESGFIYKGQWQSKIGEGGSRGGTLQGFYENAPAPVTTDEAFNRAQERIAKIRAEREQIQAQMRGKLGQASMGADPELAFLAVKLAVNYAQEGIVRFSDWSARVRQDFPDMWDSIKDYLQDAWNSARTQVEGLEPLEAAPAAGQPIVTEAGQRIETQLPLAPAPTGERPQVTITPPTPRTSTGITPEEDAEYQAAVGRNDLETAQKLVDRAALKAGYTTVAWQGSEREFNTLRPSNYDIVGGIFLGLDQRTAGLYGDVIRKYYVKARNTFAYEDDPDNDSPQGESWQKYAIDGFEVSAEKLKSDGFDSVARGLNEFIIFDSSQAKLANPVAYDDRGNLIPLSQRFNEATGDVRGGVGEGIRGTQVATETQPTFSPVEGGLPLAPAPTGERPAVTIAPPQRVEGVMPGGLVEYRQNLVQEARDAGVRTVRRSFEEIEADMKGKGWNGRKALKQFVREVMDQANTDLQEGTAAPTQVIPGSKEEGTVYEETRKNQTVPTMATIINRLAAATGRTLKAVKEARTKIRPDKETQGYISNLRSIQKNAETQLATDLGITNPETIRFTADLDDKLRIPNRVTTTIVGPGTLTNINVGDLTVATPDQNATQEEIEQTLMDNRTKVRAFLATLPNGSYEVQDADGNAVGTLTIARPEVVQQTPAQQQVAKNLPKLRGLLQQKSDLMEQIRTLQTRINRGNAGQPLPAGDFRKALEEQLASLSERSGKLEVRISKFLDTTRQAVMKFAETATAVEPNAELLAVPPSTEGTLSDFATFTEADGNEGLLFDAIEYLSGNLDISLDDVFVNDSEITARQLDQGRTLVVPTELRERVAPGITFDPETGIVTSAVSAINGGTRVTAAGELQAAANEAKTIMDTDFNPVPEELVNISDVIAGINRDPKTGAVVSTDKPMTAEQIALVENADGLLATYTTNSNVDEDRATQIARIIYARAIRKGVSTTPRRAFSQAIRKLLERQQYRPQILSTDAAVRGTENVFLGDRLSVAGMLEEFEGARPVEEGYAEEPSPARVVNLRNALDTDELIYRQTTLRHARLIAADPEINNSSETFLKEHAREMLTLRRRLAKDGKLRGFTQEEIANFTMSVLRDLDKNPMSARGMMDNRGFYSADPDSVEPSDTPATNEERGRALRIIREVISKFYPGIREVVVTDGKGRMHVDPALSRSLFTNPERVAETIRGMDDDEAAGFVRALALHEYYHLGILRKVGIKGLEDIGKNMTDAQLEEAADIYYSQATFATDADRQAAYDKFKKDRVSAAIEFITMLAERMKNGQSVQEMPELAGMSQSILKKIISAIKAIWRRLETHVRVSRNPGLREKLDNLFDGVRELDELAYGESVYPERNVELREAPEQYWNEVGRIFESYKADGRKAYTVKISGNKPRGTTAANPDNALRQAINSIIRDEGKIIVDGRPITSPGLAYSLISDKGPAIKFAKLTVPKAERAMAQATAQPDAEGRLTQGNFKFYSYSPDTRVRVGMVGPEKGGFWSNIKAMFTGRFSETRAKTGGLGSSGKFTPEQRDIRLRQAAKINAVVAKAEFLVKKYQRVLKKLYKGSEEIPTDIINTALGSTENKYTDDQYAQLQAAADEEARAALVRKFMEENIAAAETRISNAQAQLPEELVNVIRDMRETITTLSDKLLAGGYISEKLKPIVEANRNVYLHRSYTIFDNPLWKQYMENPEPGSEHERIVNAADRLFRLKAQADIARDLRNEAAKSGIELSVDESLEKAAAYKDDIAREAYNMMIDYLSVADDRENRFILTGTLPGQSKRDIILERGQIPKEVRELWGQIEDNETNFVKSVAKMSAFMATADTARDLLEAGIRGGYIWKADRSRDPRPPAGFRPIYAPGTISEYNPLKDAYAPKDVRDAFRSLQDVNTVKGWAKWFSGLTAWSMAMKTMGNFPQGYVRNFLGNPLLIVNGGFVSGRDLLNPVQMLRNAKIAAKVAWSNAGATELTQKILNSITLGEKITLPESFYNEAYQTKRNEYILNGVIGDNVESGLFREMIESSMDEPGIPSLWKNTKAQKYLYSKAKASVGKVRRGFEKMADIYQGVDDFWKVFAYEQEKKFQRKTHPDWSEQQIQQEAAARVRNKMPTYSLSPEVTKAIRRTPFIAPFITWTSEIIRTGANTIAIAAEDIRVGKETNNPQMIKNGLRALRGTLFSAALIPTAVAVSKAIFGYDEEDDEAIRQFVPEYEKNDQLFYFGQREDGKASYINLSYLDPQQMRAETAIAFYRALRGDEGVGGAFIDAASQMLQPILSEQLFAGAVMDLARNRTAQGGTIWNEQDTPTNITIAKLTHLGKALAPGIITGAGTRIYRAQTEQVTGQGRSYDLSNELAGVAFGQRVAEIDAQTDLGNKVRAFLSNRSDATRLLTSVLNSRGTVDIEEIPVAYTNANEAYQQLYKDMHKTYLAAIRLGVPKATAMRIIGGEGKERGLSDRDKAAVVTGRFPQLRLSPVTLDMTVTSAPTRQEGIARRQRYLQAIRESNTSNQ